MAKLNVPRQKIYTHEGAVAKHINAEQLLRRSVMACLLWEKQFYEDGVDIANRIAMTIPKVKPEVVSQIAIEARTAMKLRHVPLLIVREMARLDSHKHLVAYTLERIIQRADELTEFLAIYWKDGRQPLSAQVKKGLAKAFPKFDSYQLAKYNRDGVVKLRDVLFLSHAKPKDQEQEKVWKKLVDGTLEPPETWEVLLSAGEDKKTVWEKLLSEKKLGGMAFLRNLRNMTSVDVDDTLIRNELENINISRILPFRFISAARYAPKFEPELDALMLKCLGSQDKINGHTVLLVDVSGSMEQRVSHKSDITRLDAACGVAILLREICDRVDIYTFSGSLIQVPARHGFSLRDAVVNSQRHECTPLGEAVSCIYKDKLYSPTRTHWMLQGGYKGQNLRPDRLIVITDEQSHSKVPDPYHGKGYMINVGSYQNGVGYGAWLHVDGWSEAVVNYIQAIEESPLFLDQ